MTHEGKLNFENRVSKDKRDVKLLKIKRVATQYVKKKWTVGMFVQFWANSVKLSVWALFVCFRRSLCETNSMNN